ncbi:unnamed protein product [Amoebophrya sp. A120]|nr:unnamed protein product [Amoebophrya sp. A120]|eukprot:GSA120T00019145001.1
MASPTKDDGKAVARAMNNLQAFAMLGPGILTNTMSYGVAPETGQDSELPDASPTKEEEPPEVTKAADNLPVMKPGPAVSRDQLLELLKELDSYKPTAKEVTKLGAQLIKEGSSKLSFIQAWEKIEALGLPPDPFDKHNLSEARFQELLSQYVNDDEVCNKANAIMQKMHEPVLDANRSKKDLSPEQVVQIHKHMIDVLKDTITEFSALPRERRHKFSAKQTETVSELLVSMSVERKFGANSDDVEAGLMKYEYLMNSEQGGGQFAELTQQLQGYMSVLISHARPRLTAENFRGLLAELARQNKKMKSNMSEMYAAWSGGKKSLLDCYRTFEGLTQEIHEAAAQFEQISPVEMREHYDLYKDAYPDMSKLWEQSEQELQTMMTMAAVQGSWGPGGMPQMPPAAMAKPGSSQRSLKVCKMKAADVINMQEMMVSELQKLIQALSQTLRDCAGVVQFKDQLLVGLVQGMASTSVDKKFQVSADEMALAGFIHAAQLGQSERFMQSTMQQQQLLMSIPVLMENPEQGCSLM